MALSVHFYYFDEVIGPVEIFSEGEFSIEQEDIYLLLSTTEPYSISPVSSMLGPSYMNEQVIFVYNRSISNPDANDERLSLLGTDCWVVLTYPKDLEIVLLSKIELVKMILDIEFEVIDEISQITYDVCYRATNAIKNLYHE
ncbi:MAG: hypothetical protein ACTSXO_00185 [Candidatus Heimdallarchaeota archaeon]|nr:hypothetical protein [Candidatus Heimdallarchaeota archaeon]RLI67393.1 MAG: hypothetical protein DRO91_10290 [Candidatus Heimdallarchaeota archaeon]RLI69106.1 MAG: hypothetical protein DRP02_11320 [Candidatus Gerdarchaeota archaeon]